MLRFALLCPGPSLERFDPAAARVNFTIAVNRAATRFRCDTWACGDYPLIEKCRDEVLDRWPEQMRRGEGETGGRGEKSISFRHGIPPTLLTARCSATWLRDQSLPWHGWTDEFEDFYGFCDPGLKWDTFSATAALIYAAKLGARAIDVYGADWQGTQDFDGVEAGGNRSPERWQLERDLWTNIVTPWLAKRGVEVRRKETR